VKRVYAWARTGCSAARRVLAAPDGPATLAFAMALAVALTVSPAALAAGRVVDFENYATQGGEWSVRIEEGAFQVVQDRPSGMAAQFLFQGGPVPERFAFEAEFGVISGNNVNERPYFGLLFNMQYQGRFGGRVPGYRFDFRPSMFRWELVKVETGGTNLIGTYTDVMPWPWGLEEWRTLRIERDGAEIRAYVNGELLISATDDAFTGGYVGFWTYSTAAVFRSIKFEPLE